MSATVGLTTAAPAQAQAGEAPATAPAPKPADGAEILGTYSFWRCHQTLRPPLFDAAPAAPAAGGNPKAAERPNTPLPPADWVKPEFDDSDWWRDCGPFYGGYGTGTGRQGQTQSLGLVCLRGKFTVTDPARAGDLRLALAFRGGVVVHLNGQEAGRSHMPEGKVEPETPATIYPPEAFFTGRELEQTPKDKQAARREIRLRRAEMVLPAALIKKGANVLAIEIHRSPMKPYPPKYDSWRNPFNFSTCGLHEASLRVGTQGKDAVVANTTRPKGFQVWNADLLQLVTPADYGDPHEKLVPLRISGTRGGEFSAQLVASCEAPIKGLKAEVSELRAKDGKAVIPAAQARARYPRLSKLRISYLYLHPRFTWKGAWNHDRWGGGLDNFDGLLDTPPAEVPVCDLSGAVETGHQYVSGAVQPVWITVAIPADAAPGAYIGKVTVRADGAAVVEVPIEIGVSAWRMPDPKTFATIVDMAQSPETLALYYNVPLWSEKHFELIARSFKLLGSVGNDVIYVPLVGETNLGNEHTMVQWTKAADGSYKCDFTVAGKYLDAAEKYLGKPKVVCFQVWDYHLGGDITFGRMYSGKRGTGTESAVDGVLVSQMVAGGAAPATMRVPHYLSPEGKAAWRPLMDGLCDFVRKRGIAGEATLGMGGDILPNKGTVAFWKEGFPDSKWMIQGHGGAAQGSVAEVPLALHGVPVNYVSIVYGARFALGDPERGRMYGWKGTKDGKQVNTLFARGLFLTGDIAPPAACRLIGEWNIEGGQSGIGRLTADFFRISAKDPRNSYWLPQRYPKASWANAGVRPPLLAAGPDGAVATERFDLVREGLQECEARIFIEKALTDDALKARLGEKLAARAQEVLDERTRANMWVFEYDNVIDYNIGSRHTLMGGAADINWYSASGWRGRTKELFDAAAEVAGALGEK